MMYPTDKCYFCSSSLDCNKTTGSYSCSNHSCYKQYQYSIINNNIIFMINDYGFTIMNNGTMKVIVPTLKLNQTIKITKNNYLQQIERIRNLQALK